MDQVLEREQALDSVNPSSEDIQDVEFKLDLADEELLQEFGVLKRAEYVYAP